MTFKAREDLHDAIDDLNIELVEINDDANDPDLIEIVIRGRLRTNISRPLQLQTDYNNNKLKIDLNETIKTQLQHMKADVDFLKAAIADLQKMHVDGGEHIPTIITTKAQAEALKSKINKEERVLVHTTFDRALNILE